MKDNFLNSALILFAFGAIVSAAMDGARSTGQPPAAHAESMVQTEPTVIAAWRRPSQVMPAATVAR